MSEASEMNMMNQEPPEPLKVVFMGTPDFAAVILDGLHRFGGSNVVGVYTQPDRPCGRGRECKPGPVKKLALELGYDVFQPDNFKDPVEVEKLRALEPDVLVVAAYGLILPQSVLDTPKQLPLNVHASLLPRYRGAAPIQRAIEAGDIVTGITIMKMEAGLDTGPMMLQRALRIAHNDHAGQIHDELAELGVLLICEALTRIAEKSYVLTPQDESLASYAPKLAKDEGRIDWNRPAEQIHNQIRAMHPWPGAWFDWTRPDGKVLRLTVLPGEVGQDKADKVEPGTVLGEMDGRLAIATADHVYLTPEVKPQGKKGMDATAFACGYLKDCD